MKVVTSQFCVTTVKDGDPGSPGSPFVGLDLTNEYQMVLTSSEGKVTAESPVFTACVLLVGGVPVAFPAPTAAVLRPTTGNAITPTVTPSSDGTSYAITYIIPKSCVLAQKYDLEISVTYEGTTYKAQLTIAASMGSPEYHIQPSRAIIVFARNDDNSLWPSQVTEKVTVLKIDDEDTNEHTLPFSEVVVRYSTNGTPPSSKTSGTAWGTGNSTAGISWQDGDMVIANTVEISVIHVAMFNNEGTLLDRESIPIIRDGKNGEKGDDGEAAKMYWYWGEWNSWTDGSAITITENQTCYFKYDGEYWMWVGGAGAFTKAQMRTPSDSNTNFEKVQSRWKYILSEAIFTEFAKLGGFIISGEWMISTYGTLKWWLSSAQTTTITNDTASYAGKSAYMWFKSGDPTGTATTTSSTSTWRFIPQYMVNGRTGKVYMTDAYVKGQIEATSGTFNGTVKANLMYSKVKTVSSQTYTINPSSDPAHTYFVRGVDFDFTLPSAITYEGIELQFYATRTTRTGNYGIKLTATGSDKIWIPTSGVITEVSSIKVGWFSMVTLKAIGGAWHVIGGEYTT